jgi:uncharacterized SAM-binding protein YcdF (DUF218 family)
VRTARWRIVAAALVLLLLLLALAHPFWLSLIGRFLIVREPLQRADALVPLAGNVERVEYAAELFEQGFAESFVATNMPHKTPGVRESYSELVAREASWHGVPASAIVQATTVVSTTYQEALVVRDLAQQHEWQSLLVVTSPSHTRRARYIFRDVFHNTGIRIHMRAVADHWYTPDSWWRRQDGLRATWTEYLKFVMYLIGYRQTLGGD